MKELFCICSVVDIKVTVIWQSSFEWFYLSARVKHIKNIIHIPCVDMWIRGYILIHYQNFHMWHAKVGKRWWQGGAHEEMVHLNEVPFREFSRVSLCRLAISSWDFFFWQNWWGISGCKRACSIMRSIMQSIGTLVNNELTPSPTNFCAGSCQDRFFK